MLTNNACLLKTTFCSLLLIGTSGLCANSAVDYAITQYEQAANSGDIFLYKNACDNLVTVAKNADANGALFCWQTATDVAPKHNHGKRIAAYLCSVGLWGFIDTVTHTLSTRGDTTPCLVTSTLSGVGAGSLTLAALVYASMTAAGIASRNGDLFAVGALGTVGLSTLAALNWSSVYLNILASREKTAFDDAHKTLLRSLENIIHAQPTLIIIENNSSTTNQQ